LYLPDPGHIKDLVGGDSQKLKLTTISEHVGAFGLLAIKKERESCKEKPVMKFMDFSKRGKTVTTNKPGRIERLVQNEGEFFDRHLNGRIAKIVKESRIT
jgi:hypothetical protein